MWCWFSGLHTMLLHQLLQSHNLCYILYEWSNKYCFKNILKIKYGWDQEWSMILLSSMHHTILQCQCHQYRYLNVWKDADETKMENNKNSEGNKLFRISEVNVMLTRNESYNGWRPRKVKVLSVDAMRKMKRKCFLIHLLW